MIDWIEEARKNEARLEDDTFRGRPGWKTGYNLRRVRITWRMTAIQLSKRYGCDPRFINQLEQGHRSMGPRTRRRMAEILGCDEGDFLLSPRIGRVRMSLLEEISLRMERFMHVAARDERPDRILPILDSVFKIYARGRQKEGGSDERRDDIKSGSESEDVPSASSPRHIGRCSNSKDKD